MNVQKLWAPWRLEYIKDKQNKTEGSDLCPFCEIPKEEASENNLCLYQDSSAFVVMNKFPYNPGHLLVIPIAHSEQPDGLPPGVWEHLSTLTQLSLGALKQAYEPQGFNVGINLGASGGAGIPAHLHWHIVPRWNGDTNFMPLIAETKALPTHNLTVYRQLKKFFDSFPAKI